MSPLALWLLGLELTRFAPADDPADALAASLSAVEAGGWSLAPYAGPALQPLLGVQRGRLSLALAPGLALSGADALGADGRTARLRTWQGRLGLEPHLHFGHGLAGLDLAVAGGGASLDGEPLASAPLTVELAPTAGVRAALSPSLTLDLRARWRVSWGAGALEQGLGGALSLIWRPGEAE